MEQKKMVWGASKKARLSELYAGGASIPDLAAAFGTDESAIYKAVDKFGFERSLPDPTSGSMCTAMVPVASRRSCVGQAKALIHSAMLRNMCIVSILKASSEEIVHDLAYELGKQYMYLSEAESAMARLLEAENNDA